MTPQFVLLAGVATAAVCAGLGYYVAGVKGRGRAEGVLFGALLGPLGILVVALLPEGPGDAPPKRQPDIARDRDDVEGFDLRKVIEDPRGR
jgi:hypothetical protein